MGLATLSSETVASETGSECDTPREDRNRAVNYRCESNGVSIEVSQSSLTKCPWCTACYKSANALGMHLRRTHGDYRKVRSLKQSMTSGDPKSRPTTQPDNDARSNSRSRRCEVA